MLKSGSRQGAVKGVGCTEGALGRKLVAVATERPKVQPIIHQPFCWGERG